MTTRPPVLRRRQSGQSFLEYLVVTLFAVVLAFSGDPSPVGLLMAAVQKHFTDYSFAMSIAAIPNCSKSWNANLVVDSVTVAVDTCPDLKNPTWPVSITTD